MKPRQSMTYPEVVLRRHHVDIYNIFYKKNKVDKPNGHLGASLKKLFKSHQENMLLMLKTLTGKP